jgi:hypothetical protein
LEDPQFRLLHLHLHLHQSLRSLPVETLAWTLAPPSRFTGPMGVIGNNSIFNIRDLNVNSVRILSTPPIKSGIVTQLQD